MNLPSNWANRFEELWSVDFEYRGGPEFPHDILCMVAVEIKSGQIIRLRSPFLKSCPPPHFLSNNSALTLAYGASAEAQCFHVLNWPMPKHFLDLMPEYLNQTNNLGRPYGMGLVGCLAHLNIDFMSAQKKDSMRDLILSKENFTADEWNRIENYCEEDARGCANGFIKLSHKMNIDHALLRSRAILALWKSQHNRVAINENWLRAFQNNTDVIRSRLIDEINPHFDVYVDGVFKTHKFAKYLVENNIPWPQTPSGNLDLRDATFKEMAGTYPKIAMLCDLRSILSQLRLTPLTIYENKTVSAKCFPFGTKTGRFQPLASENIFGRGSWLKNFIEPSSDDYMYYLIDIKQEEFGIAAALSQDKKMIAAYDDDDCYLAYGKQTGFIPDDATATSHPYLRELLKQCVLSQNYLQSAFGFSKKLNITLGEGAHLISKYRDNFSTYWRWSEAMREVAYCKGYIDTTFGWRLHVADDTNERTVANFPMQGNAAEILRLALILMIENKIVVCAVIHDAFLIKCPTHDTTILPLALECVTTASRIVLNGFELKCDVKPIFAGQPLKEKKGREMWLQINQIMKREGILPVP